MERSSTFKPFPDPGILPTKPPPAEGERIIIQVDGLPPFKGGRHSLRSPKSPIYQRFVDLRLAATRAMDGRSWYEGDVWLRLTLYLPDQQWPDKLIDDFPIYYVSGVMDTIDGSHGTSFTYLPIVVQDDRQVHGLFLSIVDSDKPRYEVEISFGECLRLF